MNEDSVENVGVKTDQEQLYDEAEELISKRKAVTEAMDRKWEQDYCNPDITDPDWNERLQHHREIMESYAEDTDPLLCGLAIKAIATGKVISAPEYVGRLKLDNHTFLRVIYSQIHSEDSGKIRNRLLGQASLLPGGEPEKWKNYIKSGNDFDIPK